MHSFHQTDFHELYTSMEVSTSQIIVLSIVYMILMAKAPPNIWYIFENVSHKYPLSNSILSSNSSLLSTLYINHKPNHFTTLLAQIKFRIHIHYHPTKLKSIGQQPQQEFDHCCCCCCFLWRLHPFWIH